MDMRVSFYPRDRGFESRSALFFSHFFFFFFFSFLHSNVILYYNEHFITLLEYVNKSRTSAGSLSLKKIVIFLTWALFFINLINLFIYIFYLNWKKPGGHTAEERTALYNVSGFFSASCTKKWEHRAVIPRLSRRHVEHKIAGSSPRKSTLCSDWLLSLEFPSPTTPPPPPLTLYDCLYRWGSTQRL
jgi:hypothetical protein